MSTELETLIELFKTEHQNFETKQTQAAATRSRAHLLSIKKKADTLRKDILVKAKSLKEQKTVKKNQPTKEPVPEPPAVKKTKRKPKKTS